MPFLNQQKGKKDRRNYIMVNLHENYVPELDFEFAAPTDWAMESVMFIHMFLKAYSWLQSHPVFASEQGCVLMYDVDTLHRLDIKQ